MIAVLLIEIFLVGFFINLLYELLHSVLYATCLNAPLKKYLYLILKGATFDGAAIVIIYLATAALFGGEDLFYHRWQAVVFIILSIAFAYAWEMYSLKKGKWEYAATMPKIWGVGVTSFIQLALTGILSLYIVFYFFV